MRKIISFLGPILTAILAFVFLFLYFAGLVHSYKAHSTKDFIASVAIPPFTIYRGAEMFWHTKEKVMSSKPIKNDSGKSLSYLNEGVQTAVSLIMSTTTDTNAKLQAPFIKSKTDFKNITKNLHQQDLDYIKDGTMAFLDYVASMQYDLIHAVGELKLSNEFNFHQSEKSSGLGIRCKFYGLDQEVLKVQKEMEQIESGVKLSLQQDPTSINDELFDIDQMKAVFDMQIEEIRATYDDIFSKED